MKIITKIFTVIILTCFFSLASSTLFADGPVGVPDDPSTENGGNNGAVGHPIGGSAPIGSGLVFMLLYAGAYGSKKVYKLKNTKD